MNVVPCPNCKRELFEHCGKCEKHPLQEHIADLKARHNIRTAALLNATNAELERRRKAERDKSHLEDELGAGRAHRDALRDELDCSNATRDRYEHSLREVLSVFEWIGQETCTMGSDYGRPHVAEAAQKAIALCNEALNGHEVEASV